MQIVKVRLRKPTRVFTSLCPDIPLTRNETCIVKSDRGLEYGICILPPEPCPEEMAQQVTMNVLRKATAHDENTFRQILTEEHKAREVWMRKVRERNLPMKLVDVEYTFDKHKVVFYFAAAERVDFRELVRDLAHELKGRVELRHIQVRDEAKLAGGIGVCGRELCCSTWLREFLPISMRMAKRQSLALNPSKISGQCGRLLCCLGYENDLYLGRRARVVEGEQAAESPEKAAVQELEVPYAWEEPVFDVQAALDESASAENGVPAELEDDEGLMHSAVVEIAAQQEAAESELPKDDGKSEGASPAGDTGPRPGPPAGARPQASRPSRSSRRRRRRKKRRQG